MLILLSDSAFHSRVERQVQDILTMTLQQNPYHMEYFRYFKSSFRLLHLLSQILLQHYNIGVFFQTRFGHVVSVLLNCFFMTPVAHSDTFSGANENYVQIIFFLLMQLYSNQLNSEIFLCRITLAMFKYNCINKKKIICT